LLKLNETFTQTVVKLSSSAMAHYVKGYESNDDHANCAGNANGPALGRFADQSAYEHVYGVAEYKQRAETYNDQDDDFF
jgi:hypothetical protein